MQPAHYFRQNRLSQIKNPWTDMMVSQSNKLNFRDASCYMIRHTRVKSQVVHTVQHNGMYNTIVHVESNSHLPKLQDRCGNEPMEQFLKILQIIITSTYVYKIFTETPIWVTFRIPSRKAILEVWKLATADIPRS